MRDARRPVPRPVGAGQIHRMNVHQTASVPSPQPPHAGPQVSAERGALLGTLAHLWPFIWPADRADLRLRVIGALVLLLLAKLATLAVPFTFKWATDALAGTPSALGGSWLGWALAAPILMTVAYG